MKDQEITIETKKLNDNQIKVTVTESISGEIKSYIEENIKLVDSLNSEDEEVQYDAMQIVIEKSGF